MLHSEENEQAVSEQQPSGSSQEQSEILSDFSSANDDDLIGAIMGEEAQSLHPSIPRGQVEDLVEAIYGTAATAHDKHCKFIPYVSQYGIVFCLSCGSTVSDTNDVSHCFCPKCGCANSAHLNGRCLMLVDGKPCPCSDDHEFRSTSFDTQTKEAKKWLAKRKQQHARRSAATRTS